MYYTMEGGKTVIITEDENTCHRRCRIGIWIKIILTIIFLTIIILVSRNNDR